MTISRVQVQVSSSYEVLLGRGLLDRCGETIRRVCGPVRAAVITDSHVAALYLSRVQASLTEAGIDSRAFVFPAGEASKNFSTLSELVEFLAQEHFVRSDLVIALGGGVTGDMAGFAAAVYLRGIRYVQIPTTLLAAVDSSVGGKTAIDLAVGKNLAGAFKQPEIVLFDPDTLKTLPAEEMACGMAESIKYGVLFDRALFDAFDASIQEDTLCRLIRECISHKARIVEKDEFDTGERRLLNLGHTLGHGIEQLSDFSIRHGHAVAAGMVLIARAGEQMGITEAGTAAAIAAVLQKHGLPCDCEFSTHELLQAALSDKKRSGSSITLVIPRCIGECILHTVPVEKLLPIIELARKQA